MSLWSRWVKPSPAKRETDSAARPPEPGPVRLAAEPFVFECRSCGKVFERRRLRPLCPECDGTDVERLG